MSERFKLRVPDEIAALIRSMHPLLKKRIKAALSEISSDPYCGRALKADLSGLRSFRIKKFRIIYRVSHNNEVSIVALGPRKYIYEETFRIIKREEEKRLPGSEK
jgi:mRNA interferase RelE/StbE